MNKFTPHFLTYLGSRSRFLQEYCLGFSHSNFNLHRRNSLTSSLFQAVGSVSCRIALIKAGKPFTPLSIIEAVGMYFRVMASNHSKMDKRRGKRLTASISRD